MGEALSISMGGVAEARAVAAEWEKDAARIEFDAASSEAHCALCEERLASALITTMELREASANASLELAVISGTGGRKLDGYKTDVHEAKNATARATTSLRVASKETARANLEVERARAEIDRASEELNRTRLEANRDRNPEYNSEEDSNDLARNAALSARKKAGSARKIASQSRARVKKGRHEESASPTSVNPRKRNREKSGGILLVLSLKSTSRRLKNNTIKQ